MPPQAPADAPAPQPLANPAALVPVTLIGAAAGAAVAYTVEEGDITAVRRKLLPRVRARAAAARDEVAAVAADVRRDAERLGKEQQRALKAAAREAERLAPGLHAAAGEAERALLPVAADLGRRELQRALRELESSAAAAAGESDRYASRHGHARRHGGGEEGALLRRFLGGGSDSE